MATDNEYKAICDMLRKGLGTDAPDSWPTLQGWLVKPVNGPEPFGGQQVTWPTLRNLGIPPCHGRQPRSFRLITNDIPDVDGKAPLSSDALQSVLGDVRLFLLGIDQAAPACSQIGVQLIARGRNYHVKALYAVALLKAGVQVVWPNIEHSDGTEMVLLRSEWSQPQLYPGIQCDCRVYAPRHGQHLLWKRTQNGGILVEETLSIAEQADLDAKDPLHLYRLGLLGKGAGLRWLGLALLSVVAICAGIVAYQWFLENQLKAVLLLLVVIGVAGGLTKLWTEQQRRG